MMAQILIMCIARSLTMPYVSNTVSNNLSDRPVFSVIVCKYSFTRLITSVIHLPKFHIFNFSDSL